MQWLARFFVFASAFLLSTAIVRVLWVNSLAEPPPTFSTIESFNIPHVDSYYSPPSIQPAGITVMYSGWEGGSKADGPYLKFIIYNSLDQTIGYVAKEPTIPFATLRANGKKVMPRSSMCGDGIQNYSILPRNSAEVHVHPPRYLKRPRRGEPVTASFGLFTSDLREYNEHVSEPFVLPEEFRRSIEIR